MNPRLLFYISGHGFGHAARDVEVINAIVARRPDLQITLRTDVPEWFLRESLTAPIDRVAGDVDTGLVQPDGISLDEEATARNAARFYSTFQARVTIESERIRALGAHLVLGDIPPLASAAAHQAGVPSVAIGNFTWDWVYEAYPHFATLAPGVIDTIGDAYALTSVTLRLPFAGGFSRMSPVTPVPLVARHARVSKALVRERLGLDATRPVVLASFGGHGGAISLEPAAATGAFTLVTTGHGTSNSVNQPSRVHVVTADTLRHAELSYTDLLAASDVVASKLGYGIVADCIANNVPLLYTLRGRFVEQDVFTREVPAVLRCRYLDSGAMREGRWADAIDALLAQPAPADTMATNGAEVIAARIADLLSA